MPTPSQSSNESIVAVARIHPSCPPDYDRNNWWAADMDVPRDEAPPTAPEVLQQPTPPPEGSRASRASRARASTNTHIAEQHNTKKMPIDEENSGPEMLSPMIAEGDKEEDNEPPVMSNMDLEPPPMGYDFSNIRVIPYSPFSFLRAGSRFHGTQSSERSIYQVQIEIKYVDLRESYLCGYLRIQGLTEDHPTLTTYFEGEIIGSKYNFLTRHQDWGSTDNVDLQHWAKFSAFRPYQNKAMNSQLQIPQLAQRENIFMRWKERFLVPDHRVRTIAGASFDGFYYICFNQIQGTISGIYFHANSEQFQQLELKRVEDKGCLPAMEFR